VQEFARVQEFDATLKKASSRLENTPSIAMILSEIDNAVAQPIQIRELSMERVRDQYVEVEIEFTTDTLDAAMFQRNILSTVNPIFTDISVEQVDILPENLGDQAVAVDEPQVAFRASFVVFLQSIVFDPNDARRQDAGTDRSSVSRSTTPFPSQVDTDLLEDVSLDEEFAGFDEEFESEVDVNPLETTNDTSL